MLVTRKMGSILTLCSFLAWMMTPSSALGQTAVNVPIGTAVVCAFEDAVSPTATTAGQSVILVVVDDVVVDGRTVISAGAPVRGEVVLSETKGSIGKPAKVHVAVRTVDAVDGTSIALSGTKVAEGQDKQTSSLVITILCCVLGLLQKGGDAEIPAGATLTASTMSAATVTVQE